MRPSLQEVAAQKFDLIVIGGGINGAAIAREAQWHGYRTLLVERNDFGSGTTSRATRLIHGGLRYLEHGELALVYESLAERETLVREAAHLVRPLRMLVPVYDGDERPAWKIRAGLVLYDLLSFAKSMPRHRSMSPRAIDELEPKLSKDGLRAAYAFYDAQVEFPERLVAESVHEFIEAGGTALNHATVTRIVSPGGVLRGLTISDGCAGEDVEVRATTVVNAAGPWVDEILRGSDAERHNPLLSGTKGSHLVVEWPEGPQHAVFASAKEDGRPFFILPWYQYTLIGTTDMRYQGSASNARCTRDELRYLLEESNRLFPATPLREADVLYTYSGIRPLPYTKDETEGSITRSHFVIDHTKTGGPAGLLSVVGGKLTTYRSLARATMKPIAKHASPSLGARTQIHGGFGAEANGEGPLRIYGRRADEVRALIDVDAALAEPICVHNPDVLAQVVWAAEREQAVTLADALLRRLPVGWSKCHAFDGAERVAEAMGARLGWDAARIAVEVEAYAHEVRETLVPLSDIDD